ncbi:hypothetical protein JKP88DRAFT_280076 [Tribonema minus]|uniref:Uncharacterized protein n=1 Tax=Tribonema minus TaxID=303371 RepID=A0A835YRT5_9STRA|nr:hypothetical protein JKP88DRAFT_280076 [Tribonema minus]
MSSRKKVVGVKVQAIPGHTVDHIADAAFGMPGVMYAETSGATSAQSSGVAFELRIQLTTPAWTHILEGSVADALGGQRTRPGPSVSARRPEELLDAGRTADGDVLFDVAEWSPPELIGVVVFLHGDGQRLKAAIRAAVEAALRDIRKQLLVGWLLLSKSTGVDNGVDGAQAVGAATPGLKLARIGVLLMQRFRIPIVVLQVLTQYISITGLTLPLQYLEFLRAVDFLSLDTRWLTSPGCAADINFYGRLLVATLAPLAITALIFTPRFFLWLISRRRHAVAPKLRQVVARDVNAFLVFIFLIFSGVSLTVFETFGCDKLNTGNFLRADYSLECDDEEGWHTKYSIYPAFMIVVYPVGIPALYATILWRSAVKQRDRTQLPSRLASASSILWRPYKGRAYYWEPVECLRRLMLAGLLVFIMPGSPSGSDGNDMTWDGSADGFCGAALISGQAVGACGLSGTRYFGGSGTALLGMSRFRSFAPGAPALSTDRNVAGVLADVIITNNKKTSRVDLAKALQGTAQVDFFLCSDPTCVVMADLMYVAPTAPATDGNAITIATAYTRFPNSKTGVHGYYIPDSMHGALYDYSKVSFNTTEAATGAARNPYSKLQQVVWSLPVGVAAHPSGTTLDAATAAVEASAKTTAAAAAVATEQWFEAMPTLFEVGGATRLFGSEALANIDWSQLRIGTYELTNGDCVTIISFVHEWMDGRGWGTSVVCASGAPPTRTYIFDSYFPQASVQWPPTKDDAGQYVFEAAAPGARSGWKAFGTGVAGETALDDSASPTLLSLSVLCDDFQFKNSETVGAGNITCYTTTLDLAISQAAHTGEPPYIVPYTRGGADAEVDTGGKHVVLPLRGTFATVLALDITEPALRPAAGRHGGAVGLLTADGTTFDYDNQAAATPPPVNKSAPRALLKLASMATGQVKPLPWLAGDNPDYVPWETYQHSVVTLPRGQVPLLDALDWETEGWGQLEPSPKLVRAPASSGAAMRARMAVSFVDLMSIVPGFTGYERGDVPALVSAMDKIAAGAAQALDAGISLQLGLMDASLTVAGALYALAISVVALIAIYASRRDTLHLFLKVAPPTAAVALTALVSVFAVLTPALLQAKGEVDARGSNPSGDGDSAVVTWQSASASGYGDYQVVAMVSTSYTATYDSAARVIVWCNLALAVVGSLLLMIGMLRAATHARRAAAAAAVNGAGGSFKGVGGGAPSTVMGGRAAAFSSGGAFRSSNVHQIEVPMRRNALAAPLAADRAPPFGTRF